MLEDNNKRMLETISQLASSTPTIFQAQPVHLNGDEDAIDGSTPLAVNTNVNGGNRENVVDVVSVENPNLNNSSVVVRPTITSIATISATTTQGFMTMEELQKLLDQKNKRFNFLEFDFKFPYPARCLGKSSSSLLKRRLISLIWEENIKSPENTSWNTFVIPRNLPWWLMKLIRCKMRELELFLGQHGLPPASLKEKGFGFSATIG
ncbi:H0502G05.11 protein [Theobroma cacao]|uniref:H0502G05.11 protein n=1 Tax=Theobroma cacao TaxID=3641 RepID=A0A061FQR9_THECC|nr:H0502G05.11 protein [Theobroma cacao]